MVLHYAPKQCAVRQVASQTAPCAAHVRSAKDVGLVIAGLVVVEYRQHRVGVEQVGLDVIDECCDGQAGQVLQFNAAPARSFIFGQL